MSLGSYLKWDSSYTEQNETKKPFYGLLCGGFVLGLYVLGVAFGQRQQWWMRVCSNRCPCTILGDEFEFTQELRLDNQPLKTPCLSSQDQKNKLSIWFFKWRVRTGSYCTGPHLLRLPIKCYLTARYEPKTLFFSLFLHKQRELRYSALFFDIFAAQHCLGENPSFSPQDIFLRWKLFKSPVVQLSPELVHPRMLEHTPLSNVSRLAPLLLDRLEQKSILLSSLIV